ncbi:MAG TPA: hypothetical protein VK918_10395 [Pyrinomonadaceae bacterium]|nr:hypothetical protein [Pyrinomonadaceae bacterium]
MFFKNIPKFFLFVILLALLSGGALYWIRSPGDEGSSTAVNDGRYSAPEVVGRLELDRIDESSGMAASPCQPGVLWTHNDSGDDEFIYAFAADGRNLGIWRVEGARHIDWEDMAVTRTPEGDCYLYIGEIGNNDLERRGGIIYRVREPDVPDDSSKPDRKRRLTTDPAEALPFVYSHGPHDAEALLVHPVTGIIYIVTKEISRPALVYRIDPRFGGGPVTAERIATVSLPAVPNGLVTAGDISPDGTRLILTDYIAGYEFLIPQGDDDLKAVWQQKPAVIDLGKRDQGEAVAYGPDGFAIFATGEKRNSEIFRVLRSDPK